METVQTENKSFVRDIHSKALLSTDKVALENHRQRQRFMSQQAFEWQEMKIKVDELNTVKDEIIINANNGARPVLIENDSSALPQNREEIDLWVDDFETDLGWSTGSGWEWSTADYNSATHSMHSGNTSANASFDLAQ